MGQGQRSEVTTQQQTPQLLEGWDGKPREESRNWRRGKWNEQLANAKETKDEVCVLPCLAWCAGNPCRRQTTPYDNPAAVMQITTVDRASKPASCLQGSNANSAQQLRHQLHQRLHCNACAQRSSCSIVRKQQLMRKEAAKRETQK